MNLFNVEEYNILKAIAMLTFFSPFNLFVCLTKIQLDWSNINIGVRVMVFNTICKNISAISRWSILLVEETGVPRENHWQTLSHNAVSSTPQLEQGLNSQL